MSRRRKSTDTTPFDTLRLEGSLFVPELLERASRGEATAQKEADYAIPKGLKLHDEYGRAFRIATALWPDFAAQIPRADLDPATTTRAFVLDLLRQCLGYTDVAPLEAPIQLGDRGFPVTAMACGGGLPVVIAPHSLGLDDPDPRFAIHGSGSRKKSAHQLAQEFLNASPAALWAIVTNGRTLRLLRDADTLTRPNFLEFDLETILRDDQHRYADFSALWRLLHASRAGEPGTTPSDCIWEKWKSEGHAQGLRIRDGLRDGVTQALLILGRGFLTQPDNTTLRQRLHDGTLTTDAYFQQLLRLIYRSLFLFCAEERDLLHPPDSTPSSRQAYATGYSLRRFRSRALRQSAHDPHGDLWQSLRIVFRALSGGQPRLALPALGGLFAETQCPDLDSASLTNRDLLSAMRELRWFFDKKTGKRSAIDYRNMGPEELGSVYESLLELIPTLDLPGRVFGFAGITDAASSSGNARKTTGSYYTPDSLVQELIKSALDPVIAQKLADHPEKPIDALLSITVCDPSCGSGHFLLAAARRLAETLAELRASDGSVRPDDYRHALREVASRCLYGVDINPMAVELCRVALWLETVDPGKPLGFLNHHIRHGNSLLGTTPDLIAAGLPDETFTAIEGDDKPACAELKKRNKAERTGFGPLFAEEEDSIREKLRQAATSIEAMDDSQPAALHKKEAAFLTNETAPEYRHAKLLADLWCAAFVIKKTIRSNDTPVVSPSTESPIPSPEAGQLLHTDDDLFGQSVPAAKPTAKLKKPLITDHRSLGTAHGITTGTLRDFVQGKPLPEDLESEVTQLAEQYRFFHWHLAFPQVFDQGGFHCLLGNPPWERVKLQEQEFFASRSAAIANAPNAAARKMLIVSLQKNDRGLWTKWCAAIRESEGLSHFVRHSGRYPLCGKGDVNTYPLFAEHNRDSLGPSGYAGFIVPTGIATDDNTKDYFGALVSTRQLAKLYDFENSSAAGFFRDVGHGNIRFSLLTISRSETTLPTFVFFAHHVSELNEINRKFNLTEDDIASLNPNTFTCPTFRSGADAELNLAIYRRVGVLWNENASDANPWQITFLRMFDMAGDSGLFRKRENIESDGWRPKGSCFEREGRHLHPLIEAKMVHHFDHRFGDYRDRPVGVGGVVLPEIPAERKKNPNYQPAPQYWVSDEALDARLNEKWSRDWLLGWRDITRAVDQRTVFATLIPRAAVGHTTPLLLTNLEPSLVGVLYTNLCSFVLDYTTRQKIGGTHLTYGYLKQLPVLSPSAYRKAALWLPGNTVRDFIFPRLLELTYTAWDLEPFAQDCDWPGPPFRWDEDRRFLMRCELDAAFFHLYLGSEDEWRQQPEALTRAFPTPRHAVSYIMDTFPIVKRKDEAKYGTYRTKDTILQIYDALAESIQSGTAYQSRLSVPPAGILATHDPKWPATVRPTLEASDYFMYLLPLMARLQPGGIETVRLFRALEILTDRSARKKVADGGEFSARWSMSLPNTSFSDGAAALLAWLRTGNLQGIHRIELAPTAQVPVEDPWLQMDAFMALKLAMDSPLEVIRATEAKHQSIMEDITRLSA